MIEITLTYLQAAVLIVAVTFVAPFIKGFFGAVTDDILKWYRSR